MAIRIIKADRQANASSTEVFNLIDVQRQGDDIIAAAHCAADEILRVARHEAERIRERTMTEARESAREEAFQEAQTEIARQADALAEERVTLQLQTAIPALRAAAESLQAERDRWLIRWEQTAVRLGVAIAEKLVQRQLTACPEIGTEMVSDALRLAAGQPRLTVYLHPQDLAAWGERAQQIIQSLTACADTTLVPDDTSMRGGCRIETRHGEIDARVETMLQRIAEELVEG